MCLTATEGAFEVAEDGYVYGWKIYAVGGCEREVLRSPSFNDYPSSKLLVARGVDENLGYREAISSPVCQPLHRALIWRSRTTYQLIRPIPISIGAGIHFYLSRPCPFDPPLQRLVRVRTKPQFMLGVGTRPEGDAACTRAWILSEVSRVRIGDRYFLTMEK